MWVSFRKVTRRPTNPLTKARNFLRTGRHLPEILLESPEAPAEREGLVQGNEREEKRRPKRTSTSAVKRRRERKTDED